MSSNETGSPFAPHTDAETAAMLDAVGVAGEEELFDIPETVRFDDEFGIEARSERAVRAHLGSLLGRNDDLTEFLGRGHYDHYVPSVVDHLADRSEFLTSYTQYQPEVAQGFLQALFEYQSMLVELTGLDVANCSMYDAATALGEAATLAARVRAASGDVVLVPDLLHENRRSTLENYVAGADLTVESYPTDDANADVEAVADRMDDDAVMLYAESPTVRGTIEERLSALGDLAADHDDGRIQYDGHRTHVAAFLRQVPGRLVGAAEDGDGRRAYTLTLQTREQHIRKERATSNICTNQAWVALRTAMHVAQLGPDGLVDLAEECVVGARELATRVDDVTGIRAPVHDRHHFREFVARTDQPAPAVAADLEGEGFALHAIDDHLLQICTTEANAAHWDALVEALGVVA
ncbi:glycine dehydrogenase [Halobacteriales archaeon QS_5_70_17]|nr:MAG: glycine dehydrogenase [Halobacteriales archaeon QS_5_70_17]